MITVEIPISELLQEVAELHPIHDARIFQWLWSKIESGATRQSPDITDILAFAEEPPCGPDLLPCLCPVDSLTSNTGTIGTATLKFTASVSGMTTTRS